MRITCTLGRGSGVSRMSEGAFLRLKDGSILFALCRFTDETGHDDGACDLAYIVSKDEGESWSQPEILLRAKEGKKEKLSHEEKYEKMQTLLESIAQEYGVGALRGPGK